MVGALDNINSSVVGAIEVHEVWNEDSNFPFGSFPEFFVVPTMACWRGHWDYRTVWSPASCFRLQQAGDCFPVTHRQDGRLPMN
jgi:hypothetical protein